MDLIEMNSLRDPTPVALLTKIFLFGPAWIVTPRSWVSRVRTFMLFQCYLNCPGSEFLFLFTLLSIISLCYIHFFEEIHMLEGGQVP